MTKKSDSWIIWINNKAHCAICKKLLNLNESLHTHMAKHKIEQKSQG